MCTSFQLKTKDKAVLHARSQEFGIPYQTEFVIVPRGTKLDSSALKRNDFTYEAKYSFLGCNQPGLLPDRQLFSDGLNEKGLSMSMHYYYYQDYKKVSMEDVTEDQINYLMVGGYILGNISSAKELREEIGNISKRVYWPKEISDYGYGIHIIVMDNTGDSVVVEFDGQELVTKESPLGVVTNGSPLEYHYENMRLYSHLTPYEVKPSHLNNLDNHKLLTSGNGLVGLPGDYTANSRFIRAAIFSSQAEMQDTAQEGMVMAMRILGSFDFVAGVQREEMTAEQIAAYRNIFKNVRTLKDNELTVINHTDSLVVKDMTNLKFFYRHYNNITVKEIDFSKYVDTKEILIIKSLEETVPTSFEVIPTPVDSLEDYE